MARIPLLGGSYSARSVIAGPGARCINYFPEINPKDALVPLTYYQRPGLVPLVQGPNAPVRSLFRSSNGQGYAVIGQGFYAVSPQWQLTLLGQLAVRRSNPCSFSDFGQTVGIGVVVDGSQAGWSVNLGTGAFAQINDPTGIFQGADRCDYIDTFMLFNVPGTNRFISTHSNQLIFDALYVASKTTFPDPMQTLVVNRHEILLLGQLKSEIWYDAGNVQFPFAQLPGSYIEHGVLAKYSVAPSDISVFWLGQDLQGQAIVFRQRGYETKRVSNFALEWNFSQLLEAGVTLSDAIGYCYQKGGHVFYVLHLPAADQSWIFDDSIPDPEMAWHQEAWCDANGTLHRSRANCFANLYGKSVVGDWENGTIYEQRFDTYQDLVVGVPSPIVCIKTFPHLSQAQPRNQLLPVASDGQRVEHHRLQLDMECGMADYGVASGEVTLRYSNDRGKTWSGVLLQSTGKLGQYDTWPLYQSLGISRDRVYEVQHSINGPAALNGAWLNATVLQS